MGQRTAERDLALTFDNKINFRIKKRSRAQQWEKLRSKQSHMLGGSKEGRKCLFNDALNTFYLRLYGVRHMVKDHSDSKRVKPAAATWATLSDWGWTINMPISNEGSGTPTTGPETGYPVLRSQGSFPVSSKGSFICTTPQTSFTIICPTPYNRK